MTPDELRAIAAQLREEARDPSLSLAERARKTIAAEKCEAQAKWQEDVAIPAVINA
jgi:hypothetical protein